jgi:hypothetical protein
MFRKLDLLASPDEGGGDIYSVGSLRKSLPQSLISAPSLEDRNRSSV